MKDIIYISHHLSSDYLIGKLMNAIKKAWGLESFKISVNEKLPKDTGIIYDRYQAYIVKFRDGVYMFGAVSMEEMRIAMVKAELNPELVIKPNKN